MKNGGQALTARFGVVAGLAVAAVVVLVGEVKYILRSPFSQEKMTYPRDSQSVLYCSKMNPNLKRNFVLFPVLDWIAPPSTSPIKANSCSIIMRLQQCFQRKEKKWGKRKNNRPRSGRSPFHLFLRS